MIDQLDNLFEHIPTDLPYEFVHTLWHTGPLQVERIISFGHACPPGFWYDSNFDEWVVLLAGTAKLQIEGRESLVEMKPGDHLPLPAHTRHRVEWTEPDRHTIWLAVHYRPV